MTRSLGNELSGDEIQKANLYINKHKCRIISKHG